MTTCTKQRYLHESEAHTAALNARRSKFAPQWGFNVYRCDQCRFDSGQRAWHWGHRRPGRFGGRRKVKR